MKRPIAGIAAGFVLGEVRFSLNDGSDRYVPDGSLIVRSSVLYEVVLDSEKRASS